MTIRELMHIPFFLAHEGETSRVQRWRKFQYNEKWDSLNPFEDPTEEDWDAVERTIEYCARGKGDDTSGDHLLELASWRNAHELTHKEWIKLMGMTVSEYVQKYKPYSASHPNGRKSAPDMSGGKDVAPAVATDPSSGAAPSGDAGGVGATYKWSSKRVGGKSAKSKPIQAMGQIETIDEIIARHEKKGK